MKWSPDMSEQIQLLQVEIATDLQAIAAIYTTLDRLSTHPTSEEQVVALAYSLHNLYCAFENIFYHINQVFGDPMSDRARWPAEVLQLQQMTLAIEGLRPRVISDLAYENLNEMRRFRHLFRHAYRTPLPADTVRSVYEHANALRLIYQTEVDIFVAFLDSLVY